jgi:hypothetical protein
VKEGQRACCAAVGEASFKIVRTGWAPLVISDTARETRRRVLLSLVALLLAGLFAGRQISSWPFRLRYPGEICFIEGMRLAEMVHLREGVRIYDPALPNRFDAAIYGPLYYLLGARLIDPQNPAYFPLRVLSMLATLGLAAACALLAYWRSRSFIAALLAPLILLSSGFVTHYGLSSRADSLALLLVLAGVLVAYRFRGSPALLLSVPPMLLGLFYKPQFVAGPLAILVFLILQRRHHLAAVFAGSVALGGLGLLALFQFVVFPGQVFSRHLALYNFLPFTGAQFLGAIIVFGAILSVPVLVAFEFLRVHRNQFLFCYLSCAMVVALLAAGKEGSDSNYFIECVLIASALFAALFVERLPEAARARELLVLLAVTVFANQFLTPLPPQPADFARDAAVQGYLRRSFPHGTRALGYYTGDLIRAGLETPISDLYQYAQLMRQGTLADRDLVASLEKHEFGVIILTFDLQAGKDDGCLKRYLTERLAKVIMENYQLAGSLELPSPERFHPDDRFYAWVPPPGTLAAGRAAPR